MPDPHRQSLVAIRQSASHMRVSRIAYRILIFVPILSTIVLSESPTFDDIEKTLQLLGIINTLMLGCVAGSIADSGGVNGTNLSPHDEEVYLSSLYLSFIWYALGMVLIFCVYWNFVLNIEEKLGAQNSAQDSMSAERAVSFVQVRYVWYVCGRLLFLGLIAIECGASFYYVAAVTVFLGPHAWSSELVTRLFVATVFAAHLAFVPLQLSKLSMREQLRGLPPLLAGWSCCPEGCCPSLVRDFTQVAAQHAETVLVKTNEALKPPSQRLGAGQKQGL